MDDNRRKELAFLYVTDALEPGEKPVVFDLILRDEQFRRCLKEELELKAGLQSLSFSPAPSERRRLLVAIKQRIDEEATAGRKPEWLPWSEWVLRMTTPPLVFPIIQTIQRRCFT